MLLHSVPTVNDVPGKTRKTGEDSVKEDIKLAVCLVSYISFIIIISAGMHNYECVAPNVDINLQSERL